MAKNNKIKVEVPGSFVENYRSMADMFQSKVWLVDKHKISFWEAKARIELAKSGVKNFFDENEDRNKGRDINGNIEVIHCNGIIVRDIDPWLAYWYDLVDSLIIEEKIKRAIGDDRVDGIMYMFSSPGGMAQGCHTHAKFINEAAKQKPILAYTDSLEASAAFYAASACSERSCAIDADVGSVGSILLLEDITKLLSDIGVEIHEFTTGKMKTAGYEALEFTDEKKKYLQSGVDWFGNRFMQDVSQYMGIGVDKLKAHDGRCYIGEEALKHGFVDRVETFEQAIKRFSAQCAKQQRSVGMSDKTTVQKKGVETVDADYSNQVGFAQKTAFEGCGLSAGMQKAIQASVSMDGFVGKKTGFDITGYASALSTAVKDFQDHINQAVDEASEEGDAGGETGILLPVVDDVDTPRNGSVALFVTPQGVLTKKTSDGQISPAVGVPAKAGDDPVDTVLGLSAKAVAGGNQESYSVDEIKKKMGRE